MTTLFDADRKWLLVVAPNGTAHYVQVDAGWGDWSTTVMAHADQKLLARCGKRIDMDTVTAHRSALVCPTCIERLS
jgi:hypothetical protein